MSKALPRLLPVLALLLAACGAATAEPPPLPAAAEGETLPRAYLGWELGQKAPASATKTTVHPRYPKAVVHIEKLSEDPLIFRRAYVHEGTVFRIEWMAKDPSLDHESLGAAFAERLGPPMESRFTVRNGSMWSNGLTKGKTTWSLFRQPGSDWLKVIVQDEGRNLELFEL